VEGHFEYAEATSNPFATDHRGWYTYIKDQVGTIYKTFSHERQVISSTKTFDAFGNIISQTGSSQSSLGFQGKYLDQESGLYYFFHRYYNPSAGRFTTEDPIGLNGDYNLYRFELNNSINQIDPLGLKCPCGEMVTQILTVGPIDAYIAKGLSDEAFDVSESGIVGIVNKESMNGGPIDAFRHCYWSCRMAQEIGKNQAYLVGVIHEDCADQTPSNEREMMDLFNNCIGIEMYDKGGCEENCLDALKRGKLKTIK